MSCPRRHTRPGRLALCLPLSLLLAAGCATYSESVLEARVAADAGDYATAIADLDSHVGADASEPLPSRIGKDGPLILLERGLLLQAEERFPNSARDWSAADEGLEWLDLSENGLAKVGEYVYSDSSGVYRAPPSERLALNGFNTLNYLVRGDLSGAAVEARRYTVLREFLESNDIEHRGSLGAYLAGYTFERLGEGDRALRYYDEALAAGAPAQALAGPVQRLATTFPYRTKQLSALLEHAPAGRAASGLRSELLVVVATGRVPYKVPERIPIGAAVGMAGSFITGDIGWLDRGVAKVVVYPELVPGPAANALRGVRVGTRKVLAHRIDNLAADVRREYEKIKPRIIAAAISRMIARAAVAEGVRAATNDSGGWASLAAILVEGALVALDKPDTRSWTLLPAEVAIARVAVAPGEHVVEVELASETRRYTVDVPERGFTTVVVTSPR